MKKILLFATLFAFSFVKGQNIFSFGFDGVTADMLTAGWAQNNQSTSPSTTSLWTIATYTQHVVSTSNPASPFQNQVYTAGQTCPVPNGQAGGGNSFALVNYTSTSSTAASGATISNWLTTPSITVQNGDVVTFYTRKGTSGTTDYADRLELRMSTTDTPTNPSTRPTDVGGYTTLCVSVNPTLATGFIYPKVWTQYSYTVSGLSGPTSVKFGFRYYVTNGGSNGSNSDIIGIDTFSIDRTLSSDSFFREHFSLSPNPVRNFVNINGIDAHLTNVSVVDVNGRLVKNISLDAVSDVQIDLSDIQSGVYILKLTTEKGVGTTKLVKD